MNQIESTHIIHYSDKDTIICPAEEPVKFFPVLLYDSTIIQQVQQALNDAGFDCGTPDGIAGKGTAAAVPR